MGTPIAIATAVLVRNGRVLMVHRHPTRAAYPDCWGFAGGHVEPGESPRDALARECLEELGVHIQDPVSIPMRVDNPEVDMRAYLVTRWSGEPVNAEPAEHDDLRWCRPDELAELQLAHPESLPGILRTVGVVTDQQRRAAEIDVSTLSYPSRSVRGHTDAGSESAAETREQA